jgi:hypothetical protein
MAARRWNSGSAFTVKGATGTTVDIIAMATGTVTAAAVEIAQRRDVKRPASEPMRAFYIELVPVYFPTAGAGSSAFLWR